MNKIFHRIIDWIMGPNPRCHLLVLRNNGKVFLQVDFRTLMAMNELNGRKSLVLDLDCHDHCKITVNDNLCWSLQQKP